jgi:hypothetical protein
VPALRGEKDGDVSEQPDPLVMPADEFEAVKKVHAIIAGSLDSQRAADAVWSLLGGAQARAEAAEARLAEVRDYCRNPGHAYIGHLMAERILAIIGNEEK